MLETKLKAKIRGKCIWFMYDVYFDSDTILHGCKVEQSLQGKIVFQEKINKALRNVSLQEFYVEIF